MELRQAFIAGCALACSGCMPQRAVAPTAPTGPGLHVLFVGNSLTYVNDLPAIFEAMADSGREPLLETRMVAKPDYSLEDHWNDGEARTAIANGGWNVVVLQQGPSSLESSRTLLIQYVRAFGDIFVQGNARSPYTKCGRPPIVPRTSRARTSHIALAADTVQGALFRSAKRGSRRNGSIASIPLYAFDGLHPSVEGKLPRRARDVRDCVRPIADWACRHAPTTRRKHIRRHRGGRRRHCRRRPTR